MGEVVVETTGGKVGGAEMGKVATFKGIPYAAPPVGAHRFMPPQPLERWEGVRPADELGASCPQPPERPAGWDPEPSESEDCLVLNVWTPGAGDGKRRPVMVWLHGGGYTTGSASWPLYDGAALATRGDVVVVGINHRLGVLGYLHLGEVAGAEYAPSGNVGMLDLVAALEWVRDNVAVFGGDAGNVTIFGESGGGAKVATLMVMPAARRLFHKAVVQSGPGLRVQSIEQATGVARALLEELGLEAGADLTAALQALPAERLVEAQRALTARMGAGLGRGFGPVLDSAVVPAHPYDALGDGSAADVPVLIGTTRDEATLFLGRDPVLADPGSLDDEGLRRRLAPFGDHADTLIDAYRKTRTDPSPLDLLIAIQSDSFMRVPSIRFAEQKLAGGTTPVFMYLFTWAAGPLRSGHGFELPFVFDNVHDPVMRPSASRQQLADAMSEAWLAFARDSEPGHDGLPDWPTYSLADRATMIFDRDVCAVENDPFGAERQTWADHDIPALRL